MQAYLHGKNIRPDGTIDTFWGFGVPAKRKPLKWQERGLQYSASGYGKKIPTAYMVQFNGKWRRVYCCIFSNIGTCYIGKLSPLGENITVDIQGE